MKVQVTDVEIGGDKFGCLSARFKEQQPQVKPVLAVNSLTSMLEVAVVGLHRGLGLPIVVRVIRIADLINQQCHFAEMDLVEAAQHTPVALASAAIARAKTHLSLVA